MRKLNYRWNERDLEVPTDLSVLDDGSARNISDARRNIVWGVAAFVLTFAVAFFALG